MKRKASVVIIGGGAIGLSTAYQLAKHGQSDVVLLERGYLGGGATGRCAEGIRAQFQRSHNIELALASQRIYEHLAEELNYNILFTQYGYLMLAYTEGQLELCSEYVKRQKRLGMSTKLVSPEEAKELVPILNTDGVLAGTFHPKDGSAHHDSVVAGFAKAARRKGVEINEFTEVSGIRTENGRVKGVATSRGEIATTTVIIAAGAYTRAVAGWVGVNVPTQPVRHQIMVTEPLKPCINPMVISHDSGVYLRQTMRGELIGGIGDPEEPSSYNMRSGHRFLFRFAKEATRLFPVLRDVSVMRQWAGLYDMAEDGTPIIQEIPSIQRLLLACGWSGHGFMLSPIVGKLLAEQVLYRKTSLSLEPFSLRRFETGQLEYERTVVG